MRGPPHHRWPPAAIVAVKDNKGYIRVLLNSYSTTNTGWGVLLSYAKHPDYFSILKVLSGARFTLNPESRNVPQPLHVGRYTTRQDTG